MKNICGQHSKKDQLRPPLKKKEKNKEILRKNAASPCFYSAAFYSASPKLTLVC